MQNLLKNSHANVIQFFFLFCVAAKENSHEKYEGNLLVRCMNRFFFLRLIFFFIRKIISYGKVTIVSVFHVCFAVAWFGFGLCAFAQFEEQLMLGEHDTNNNH